ncbi:MAG: selenium metabolism-associated LysR family transcriptional regulator [Bacillota bacterium]
MNIKQLQVFVAVARELSFTRAANSLYMTQPAVSWQIKSLEEELEIQLLERRDRYVALTQAGEEFLAYAISMVNTWEQSLAMIGELKGFQRGHLNIASSTLPGEYLLPQAIGGFRKRYPGVKIRLSIQDTGEVVEKVLSDQAHLGVIGAKVENEGLELNSFYIDELVFIASPDHSLLEYEEVELEDLLQYPFVLREQGSGTRMAFEDQLMLQGLRLSDLTVSMELGSTRAVISGVEAGLGLSLVSRLAVEQSLALGKAVVLPVKGFSAQRELYLAARQGRKLSPLASLMKNWLLCFPYYNPTGT